MSDAADFSHLPEPLTVGLDIDNTLGSYTEAFAQHVARERGVDPAELLQVEQTTYTDGYSQWGVTDFVGTHRRAVTNGLFHDIRPYSGAVEALRRLSESGARIKVLTSRLIGSNMHATAISDTLQFLEAHGIPFDDFIVTSMKDDIECDVYIDDAPSNIEQWRKSGKGDRVIIYDQPYNRHLPGRRVSDWEAAESQLREVLEQRAASRFPTEHAAARADVVRDMPERPDRTDPGPELSSTSGAGRCGAPNRSNDGTCGRPLKGGRCPHHGRQGAGGTQVMPPSNVVAFRAVSDEDPFG